MDEEGSGSEEVGPIQPAQMDIYQSITYSKDFSWLHFHDEPRVQERLQVKGQQSYILVSVAYLTYPSSTSPDMATVFYASPYSTLIKIRATSGERNFIEQIKPPIFLETVLAIKIM